MSTSGVDMACGGAIGIISNTNAAACSAAVAPKTVYLAFDTVPEDVVRVARTDYDAKKAQWSEKGVEAEALGGRRLRLHRDRPRVGEREDLQRPGLDLPAVVGVVGGDGGRGDDHLSAVRP